MFHVLRSWTGMATIAGGLVLPLVLSGPARAGDVGACCNSGVKINEIRVTHPGGTEAQEYFELRGQPGMPLDCMHYIVLGPGGVVEEVIPLTGHAIGPDGLFLVAQPTFNPALFPPGAAVVDLVADTGIPIARATRLHRFWLAHDRHPTADLARRLAGALVPPGAQPHPAVAAVGATPQAQPVAEVRTPAGEGRGSDRVERDGLIRKLRDQDPAVRALAFEKLRPRRKS